MRNRAAVVALVAFAYIALGVNRGLSIYDEAIPVVAATRILDGDPDCGGRGARRARQDDSG